MCINGHKITSIFSVAVSNKYSCLLKIWQIRLQVICVSLNCIDTVVINPESGNPLLRSSLPHSLWVLLLSCGWSKQDKWLIEKLWLSYQYVSVWVEQGRQATCFVPPKSPHVLTGDIKLYCSSVTVTCYCSCH